MANNDKPSHRKQLSKYQEIARTYGGTYVTLQQKPTCVVTNFLTWRPSNDLSFLVGDLYTKIDIEPRAREPKQRA